jgi:hypothetical protein
MGAANIQDMPAGASLCLIGGRGTLTSQKAVALDGAGIIGISQKTRVRL